MSQSGSNPCLQRDSLFHLYFLQVFVKYPGYFNAISLQTHTHTYIYTYIHTHIHTYVRTYIHTYLVKFRLGIFGSCSVELDMSNGTCPTKTNCQEPFQLWHNFICHRGDESCISPKDFQIQMPSFRPTFFYLICH